MTSKIFESPTKLPQTLLPKHNQDLPTYTIVAPSRIRPNSQYNVNIQVANITSSVDVEVELCGPFNKVNNNQQQYKVNKIVTLNPITTTNNNSQQHFVTLQIGDWRPGISSISGSFVDNGIDNSFYKLVIQSKQKIGNVVLLNFINEESKLTFDPKICSIFVQTDKAIYKPGQLVRFRVLLLDRSLLLPKISNLKLNIFIKV